MSWRPSASLSVLKQRAGFLARIRTFFAERGVLEVETPQLSVAAITDPNLASIRAETAFGPRWLHTSPEFPMKRLLAAGSGPIFQLCKVFRDGEQGRWHNPEFTMLEWYRPGYSQGNLIAELLELVQQLTGVAQAEQLTYRSAFQIHAGIDPLGITDSELEEVVQRYSQADIAGWSRAARLDWLMGAVVGPKLGQQGFCVLTEFPADQAALARLKLDDPAVALRFELYWRGVELANGFEELTDATEQRCRMQHDLAQRREQGKGLVPPDERFLAALDAGLPPSSGVAVGVDRLFALTVGAESLAEVLAFPFDAA